MLHHLSKSNAELPELFYRPLRWMHWGQAAVVLTGLVTVGAAMNLDRKKPEEALLKRRLMFSM